MKPPNSAHVAHVPARLQAVWAGLGGFGSLRYQKSEGGSMFSMARGLFPDSLTKICDLTNTPSNHVMINAETVNVIS